MLRIINNPKVILNLFYILIIIISIALGINIYSDEYSFYLDKEEIKITLDSNYKIEIIPKNQEYIENSNYLFESSDDNIATIDENGLITPQQEGTVIITIKSKKGFNKNKLKVNIENIEQLSLYIENIQIDVGETFKVNPIINGNENIAKNYTYDIEDETIAKVDKYGNITGIKQGETIIYVSTEELSASAIITVTLNNIEIESIKLSETNISITNNTNTQISVQILPSNATNKNITWSSSNTDIVTVANDGKVTAKNIGTAVITATTENGKTAKCSVTVTEEVIEPKSISINKTNETLYVGDILNLVATISPSNATNREITWTSSDENIATVDSKGNVTSKKVGNVVITAKTKNGKTATCNITVKEKIIDVKSIALNKTSTSLYIGDKLNLTATILPSNATDKSITWSSSNTNVATVENGKVIAKNIGTTIITVKSKNGIEANCNITVKENTIEVTSITLDKTNAILNIGNTLNLTATISPTNATNKTITWSSSNTNVASVDSFGKITAKSGGNCIITAKTNNGKIATFNLTVDKGYMQLLKDTNFNNGFELWLDANEKNYKCVNCKGTQYWYIATWNFPPKFVNVHQENGSYYIDANQSDGTNTKLVTYNTNGELSLALNTYGMSYSPSEYSAWPHLLLDGMAGTNNKFYDFYSYSPLEQKYYSFTNNDIWYSVDVRLDYYSKGKPINGISACQYVSYIELRDKVTKKMIWFGFNIFDDRAAYQKSYTSFDLYTQNYIYSLGSDIIYADSDIYNNGNFIYNQYKTVKVNVSDHIDDVVKLANEKQIFGRTITKDDLFVGAVNIGFEIHGEYHVGMSMKNLSIKSVAK